MDADVRSEQDESEEEDASAPKFLWSGSGADDGLEAAITASWSKVLTSAKASVLAKRSKRDAVKLAPITDAPQTSAPEPPAKVRCGDADPTPPAEALTALLLETVTAEGRLVPTEVKHAERVLSPVATAERVRSPRSLKLEELERRNRELQQANDALVAQNQQLSDTLRGELTALRLNQVNLKSRPPSFAVLLPLCSASRGNGHAAAAARPPHAATWRRER